MLHIIQMQRLCFDELSSQKRFETTRGPLLFNFCKPPLLFFLIYITELLDL